MDFWQLLPYLLHALAWLMHGRFMKLYFFGINLTYETSGVDSETLRNGE